MATNLSIDPELIERAIEVSDEGAKKAAVTMVLEEVIARRRQRGLLDLMGRSNGIRPSTSGGSASAPRSRLPPRAAGGEPSGQHEGA